MNPRMEVAEQVMGNDPCSRFQMCQRFSYETKNTKSEVPTAVKISMVV
jgi:hypothetical protein